MAEQGTTFYDWLGLQRGRDDRVGDLARQAWEDEGFPREGRASLDLVEFMRSRGAHEDDLETAREAWEEYGGYAADFTPTDEVVDWDREEEDRR